MEKIEGIDGQEKLSRKELKSLQNLAKMESSKINNLLGDKKADFINMLKSEKKLYLMRVKKLKYKNDNQKNKALTYVPGMIDIIIGKIVVDKKDDRIKNKEDETWEQAQAERERLQKELIKEWNNTVNKIKNQEKDREIVLMYHNTLQKIKKDFKNLEERYESIEFLGKFTDRVIGWFSDEKTDIEKIKSEEVSIKKDIAYYIEKIGNILEIRDFSRLKKMELESIKHQFQILFDRKIID